MEWGQGSTTQHQPTASGAVTAHNARSSAESKGEGQGETVGARETRHHTAAVSECAKLIVHARRSELSALYSFDVSHHVSAGSGCRRRAVQTKGDVFALHYHGLSNCLDLNDELCILLAGARNTCIRTAKQEARGWGERGRNCVIRDCVSLGRHVVVIGAPMPLLSGGGGRSQSL